MSENEDVVSEDMHGCHCSLVENTSFTIHLILDNILNMGKKNVYKLKSSKSCSLRLKVSF